MNQYIRQSLIDYHGASLSLSNRLHRKRFEKDQQNCAVSERCPCSFNNRTHNTAERTENFGFLSINKIRAQSPL